MAEPSTNQRYLIVILGSLIAFKLLLAGVFGFKPSFDAGYYTPPAPTQQASSKPGLTAERKRELEEMLAPPPILAWAEAGTGDTPPALPQDLASGETLLAFARSGLPRSDDIEPQEETAQLEQAPKPKKPITQTPIPIPEITDEGIIFDQGNGLKVAPVYLPTLPDLKPLTVDQRKKRFAAIMLPLILRANLELETRRQLIVKAAQDGDIEKLGQWAELYRIKTETTDIQELRQALLLRVDQVPVSIAMAQAAIESGWGTSRFAIQGNALFGQWAWSNDLGLKPEDARYENAVVRSFANLFDSVRAYMHNLNTHRTYENFRRMRQDQSADIEDIAGTLLTYSEEGEVYIEKLKGMINTNNFTLYDNAELLPE